MKGQPFVRYVTALIAGISLYVLLPNLTILPVITLLAGLGLLIWGFARTAGSTVKAIQILPSIGALLILMTLGWAVTYQRTASNRSDNLSHVADTLQAYEGVVSAQPEERAKTYRVELEIRRATFGRTTIGPESGRNQQDNSRPDTKFWKPLSGRVIVYLDKGNQPMPRYGEVWLVSGAPRTIDPPLNPGEFNYKRYLSYRNIYHQQYLRPFQRQILGLDPPSRITQVATIVNRWAASVFTHQVGVRAEYGIVNAMILGIRDDLDTDLYQSYSAAGAVHILSVSGLHVGILFQVLTLVLGFLAKRRHGKILMAVLQLTILWFYALVTGFSPPVLRSAAMFTMVILATTFRRQQQIPNTLGASAFFILCFDPYALFSAGFQLSYLAVAGISAWQPSLYQSLTFRNKWVNKLWKLTAVALVAQLITFPLGVFYFHQFPTYFLLANPIVMVMSEILLPLAMATLAFSWVPYLTDGLGWLLQKAAWFLNYAVTQTGQLPGAAWDGLWLSTTVMLLTYVVILCGIALVLTRSRAYMWTTALAAVLLACLTSWENYQQAHQQQLTVHFLPHRTAVSLTYGRHSTLLTDLDTNDTRSYDFYLKNTFGQWGVSDLTIVNAKRSNNVPSLLAGISTFYQTREYALWVSRGKTLLLVNKLSASSRWRLPAIVDYLIIRRNALQEWEQLNGRVVARHIIFDDSNKTPLTDKLLAEAKRRGIVCYSVRQMGAYVADLE
ncbi:DUF4131 domain-containing protein [Spirosoma sp. HMF4905]|uniref:DUF4131 domain-containing protein n=1 Tax=Spirosoma arboris TaxID=2682092 RepID=A0A7K1S8C5_9BACT|nr:ComEC/Rec2 family competence protein [Spirosoma arboris]MVM30039.1 DUF4131 domain-containing protein [Spirosoma arboris]